MTLTVTVDIPVGQGPDEDVVDGVVVGGVVVGGVVVGIVVVGGVVVGGVVVGDPVGGNEVEDVVDAVGGTVPKEGVGRHVVTRNP